MSKLNYSLFVVCVAALCIYCQFAQSYNADESFQNRGDGCDFTPGLVGSPFEVLAPIDPASDNNIAWEYDFRTSDDLTDEWTIRDTEMNTSGPGPQYWSNSSTYVSVVQDGGVEALRLQVIGGDHRSTGGQVSSTNFSGGYGRYTWRARMQNVNEPSGYVCGLFLYKENSGLPYQYTEIDFEFLSRLLGCPGGETVLSSWQAYQETPAIDVHASCQIALADYGLNPAEYNEYVIDWYEAQVEFYVKVDDVPVLLGTIQESIPRNKAPIVLNIWSGSDFSGLLSPSENGAFFVDWVSYQPHEDIISEENYVVPYYDQHNTSWCAYTSIAMLTKYHGYSLEPWEIAAHFGHNENQGASASEMGYLMNPLDGGLTQCRLGDYVHSVTGWGYDYHIWWNPNFLSWSYYIKPAIVANLNDGPFLAGFIYGDAGHAVVFTGHDDNGVYLHDPSGLLFEIASGIIDGYSPPTSNINVFLSWEDLEELVRSAGLFRYIRFLADPSIISTPISIQPPHYSQPPASDSTNYLVLHQDPEGELPWLSKFSFGDSSSGYTHRHFGNYPTQQAFSLIGTNISNSSTSPASVTCVLSLEGQKSTMLSEETIENLPPSQEQTIILIDSQQPFLNLSPGQYTMKWEVRQDDVYLDEFRLDFTLFDAQEADIILTHNGPWQRNAGTSFEISGQLTDIELQPFFNEEVCASIGGSSTGCTNTQADGSYSILAKAPTQIGGYDVAINTTVDGAPVEVTSTLLVIDAIGPVIQHNGPWHAQAGEEFQIEGYLTLNGEPVVNKVVWADIGTTNLGYARTGYTGYFNITVIAPLERDTYTVRLHAAVEDVEESGTLIVTLPTANCTHLELDNDEYEETDGDDDMVPEAGERVNVIIDLSTDAPVSDLEAILASGNHVITVVDGELHHPGFSDEAELIGDVDVDVHDCSEPADFVLYTIYESNNVECQQILEFSNRFACDGENEASFAACGTPTIDDSEDGKKDGDNDGIAEGGEDFYLKFSLQNTGNANALGTRIAPVNFASEDLIFDPADEKLLGDVASGQCKMSNGQWLVRTKPWASGIYTTDVEVTWDGNSIPMIVEDGFSINIIPQPWIRVRPEILNFGAAPTTETLQVAVEIVNQGASSLTVTGYESSHDDTTITGITFPLVVSPQQAETVIAEIDTSSVQGAVSRTISFLSDGRVHDPGEEDQVIITGLVSDSFPIHSVPIDTTPGSFPDIGNDKITWAFNNKVHVFDLLTGEDQIVSTTGGAPRISGSLVAWQDYRNTSGDSDIYVYDLDSGFELQITDVDEGEKLRGVDDPYILYTKTYHVFDGTPYFNLYVFNVDTMSETAITQYSDGLLTAEDSAIGNRMIVFNREIWNCNYDGCDVTGALYYYRLPGHPQGSSGSSQLGYNRRVWNLSADENWLAWGEEGGNDYSQVKLWNNGTVYQLTPEPGGEEDEYRDPCVGNGIVTYSHQHDEDDSYTFVYKQPGGSEQFIASYNVGWHYRDGNAVVWRHAGEIFYSYLLEPDLEITTNGIEVIPDILLPSEPFSIDVLISNLAPLDYTDEIVVRVYREHASGELEPLGMQNVPGGLAQYSQATVTISNLLPLESGENQIVVQVDRAEGENPLNNHAKITVVSIKDCNENEIDDDDDIASGYSLDCNHNQVPDECESISEGDYDSNGDVDLDDYAAFTECLSGPETQPAPSNTDCVQACLDAFDFNQDDDVDLHDFAILQEILIEESTPECYVDLDCDDGLFCNGQERCDQGDCQVGIPPCSHGQCDEALDLCQDCIFTFEDGLMPDGWTTDNDGWFITDEYAYSGQYSLRTLQNSGGNLTFDAYTQEGEVRFYLKPGYQTTYFYIDEVEVGHWSSGSNWVFFSYPISEGTHTFRFFGRHNTGQTTYIDDLQYPCLLIDCNTNGIDDRVDILNGEEDCNSNGIPDECDIVSGVSSDADSNGVPDECEHRIGIADGVVMDFVFIQSDSFLMGSDSENANPDEQPVHMVHLTNDFYIGKYEVTHEQYQVIMNDSPWDGQSYVMPNAPPDCAATYISWQDASEFCRQVSLNTGRMVRLPTEAEWEYACRGGTSTDYFFGEYSEAVLSDYAWWEVNADNIGEDYAHCVGRKLPNQYGLYDIIGNVWEWCYDWKGEYQPEAQENPEGPIDGLEKVSRGGGWNRNGATWLRSAARNGIVPTAGNHATGFRVVMLPLIDCNLNTIDDRVEIKYGSSEDCDLNGILDECEIRDNPSLDSNDDGLLDECGVRLEIDDSGVTIDLMKIHAGTFIMGDIADVGQPDEDDPHTVILTSDFLIGQTEITQEQYFAVTGENPWEGQNDVHPGDCSNCAASWISWDAAVDFCKQASVVTGHFFRLPTEAEWEYACRAGTDTQYSFGNNAAILTEYAWCEDNTASESYAHSVGMKIPNPWGLYDMHGNVIEWCSDWYASDYYQVCGDPVTNPTGPYISPVGRKVLRSGYWGYSSVYCRSANRDHYFPGGAPFGAHGFRVVVDLLVDCNANGIDDRVDILVENAEDCNTNGIPDECDIESGFSRDSDFNGIPDECQNFIVTFEDGLIPAGWTTDNGGWIIMDDYSFSGIYSLRTLHNSGGSVFFVAETPEGEMSFYIKPGAHTTSFYIDDILIQQWGADSTWSYFSTAVTPGQHTFRWHGYHVPPNTTYIDDIEYSCTQ